MVSLGIDRVDVSSDLKTDDIVYIYHHIASILFETELVNVMGPSRTKIESGLGSYVSPTYNP
jgi:hypothetical protein